MKTILIFFCFLLAGCASTNPIDKPQTKEELDLWMQAEGFLQVAENKTNTLWMYSTGSFALVCLGLGIIAFWPMKRLSGLVFVAGGLVGMSCVWVFDSKWFPWVAGGTVGVVILSALAFAYVEFYRNYISSSAKPVVSPRYKAGGCPRKS